MASKRDKESDISPAGINWLEQLAAEVNIPFAPEGWYTMREICERTGRDHQVIRKILKAKNAQCKAFRSLTAQGKTIVTPHYKL